MENESKDPRYEPYFKTVNEPSYYVQLYYDALYDTLCFYTQYRFDNEELAKKFQTTANSMFNVECEKHIFFEIRKMVQNRENFRPLMTDFDVAMKDLNDFKEYCNTYYYDTIKYKYKESVIERELDEYELVQLKNENEILKTTLESLGVSPLTVLKKL